MWNGEEDGEAECADCKHKMLPKERKSTGRWILTCYIVIMIVAMASGWVISSTLTPGWKLYRYKYGASGRQTHCKSAVPPEKSFGLFGGGIDPKTRRDASVVMATSRHLYAEGAVVGSVRTSALQAAVFVLVAFGCIVLAAVVPASVVILRPELVHSEFERCGTLSNLGSDITLPRGRVFTTMLFTGSLVALVSGYTHCIYQNWFPNAPRKVDVLFFSLAGRSEKLARSAWVTLPNVGLMLTAALPSLTDVGGTNLILTIIHNVSAPTALLIAWSMEAFQLAYGENAFEFFFCSTEHASWYGPLVGAQRMRVCILGYFGIAGTMFLCIQFYLLLPVFGVKIKTSYTFAVCCLLAEITALMLAYSLPFIQGLACLYSSLLGSNVFERAAVIETLPPPGRMGAHQWAGNASGGGENSLLQFNMSHRFLHPLQRASFAKQLRAGADGLPLF